MRDRMKRNFLATLAFSQGVPMLLHGDELGRTQAGNNNAYCQDSPLAWVDWRLTPAQQELLAFTQAVFAVRAASPLLQRRTFFSHQPHGGENKELIWLDADGKEMETEAWLHPSSHVLGMMMRGERDRLLLLLNGGGRSKAFTLPLLTQTGTWNELVNTFHPGPEIAREHQVNLGPRSLLLLRFVPASRD
jgi:glycogen operon protein